MPGLVRVRLGADSPCLDFVHAVYDLAALEDEANLEDATRAVLARRKR